MNIRELVREDIRNLVPYEPHLFSNVIKLDANENSHSFPPEIIREIYSKMDGEIFTRYPDPGGANLKEKIARLSGVTPQNIVLGNGSDELIQLLLQTFGGPGKRVVIPVPTFSMYRIYGQITGTIPVEVPRDDNFAIMTENLLPEMQHEDTRITFIATPNNPTGNTVPINQIRRLASGVKSLVVVDEAYIDFGGETSLPLHRDYPNLVILRTFSKVGLAGLRVGYLVAHPEVTTELLKVKPPYNVNGFSQAAAGALLESWPLMEKQIAEIISERGRLITELGRIPGVSVYPSQANFILFRTGVPADEVHQMLLDEGILIRKNLGPTHGLDKCLRVTVGIRQENDLFLEKMNGYLRSDENG